MARCLWTVAGCFRKLCSPVLGCGVVSLVILKSFFERNSSFHPRDDNGARKVMLEVSDSSKLCQNQPQAPGHCDADRGEDAARGVVPRCSREGRTASPRFCPEHQLELIFSKERQMCL